MAAFALEEEEGFKVNGKMRKNSLNAYRHIPTGHDVKHITYPRQQNNTWIRYVSCFLNSNNHKKKNQPTIEEE